MNLQLIDLKLTNFRANLENGIDDLDSVLTSFRKTIEDPNERLFVLPLGHGFDGQDYFRILIDHESWADIHRGGQMYLRFSKGKSGLAFIHEKVIGFYGDLMRVIEGERK